MRDTCGRSASNCLSKGSKTPRNLLICCISADYGALLSKSNCLMDVELFGMQTWIALDQNCLADHLLHLLQPLRTRSLQLLDHLWINAQHDIPPIQVPLHFSHLDIDVVADGNR